MAHCRMLDRAYSKGIKFAWLAQASPNKIIIMIVVSHQMLSVTFVFSSQLWNRLAFLTETEHV